MGLTTRKNIGTIKTQEQVNQQEQRNALSDKIAELNQRYNIILDEITASIDKHKVGPIELIRISNELHAIGLEKFSENIGIFIDKRIEKQLSESGNKE